MKIRAALQRTFIRRIYDILIGLLSNVNPRIGIRKTGGTVSARYCYSIFLRHLVTLFESGARAVPKSIAEFGPGDSIGTGLCALLAGANTYIALDAVCFSNTALNLSIFEELVELFRNRSDIPDENEFPRMKPLLTDYSFPSHILTDSIMESSLNQERIAMIRDQITQSGESGDIRIEYIAPWTQYDKPFPTVELVFSQAVMQYVDDLEHVYSIMANMLRKEGYVLHEIDFTSHHHTKEWNGHWGISESTWNIIRGKRAFFLNREPMSAHIQYMIKNGLEIKNALRYKNSAKPSIDRGKLKGTFKSISEEDFNTSSGCIIARRVE